MKIYDFTRDLGRNRDGIGSILDRELLNKLHLIRNVETFNGFGSIRRVLSFEFLGGQTVEIVVLLRDEFLFLTHGQNP